MKIHIGLAHLAGILLVTSAAAQENLAGEAYSTLERDPMWAHPSAKGKIDRAQIEAAAKTVQPMNLKVLAVPNLGTKWQQNGKERRGSYAKWLLEERLNLTNAIVIVYTKQGITAYSDRVPETALANLSELAAERANANNFTPSIVWLAENVKKAADSTPAVAGTTSVPAAPKPAFNPLPFVLGAGAIGGGVWLAMRRARVASAKKWAEVARDRAVNDLSFIDSYDGLITDPAVVTEVREARERATDMLSLADSSLARAKKIEDFDAARLQFDQSSMASEVGRTAIANVTEGTNLAYRIHSDESNIDPVASPRFEPRTGTDYFTGQPSDHLQPVEISMNGVRRTVMASPETIAKLQRGEQPSIAGVQTERGFLPWYQTQGMGMDSGGMLQYFLLGSVMNSWFGHGSHTHHHNYFSDHPVSGGSDGGWSDWASSGLDSAGGFSGGDFGGSGGDFGGGDGGGDFGGGDF